MGTISGLEEHLAAARAFYGDAVDLSKVRIKGSWLVFGGAAAWTCNDVVRFKKARRAEDVDRAVLIHELAHVWEHQSGQAQILKGMVEQAGRVRGRDPYDYGGPDGVRGANRLQALTKESQAMVLQEYWRSLQGEAADTRGVAFAAGYVGDLRRLIEGAGIGGTGPPRRAGVAWRIDAAAAWLVNGFLALLGA